jgi:hypothetical protein
MPQEISDEDKNQDQAQERNPTKEQSSLHGSVAHPRRALGKDRAAVTPRQAASAGLP